MNYPLRHDTAPRAVYPAGLSQEALIRELQARLLEYEGTRLIQKPGYTFGRFVLGSGDVLVEYRYTKGRPAVHTLRNGDPGYPEDPPEAEIIGVLLNGKMEDPQDVIPDAILERWTVQILEGEAE